MQKVVRLDSVSRAQTYSAYEKWTFNVETETITKENTMLYILLSKRTGMVILMWQYCHDQEVPFPNHQRINFLKGHDQARLKAESRRTAITIGWTEYNLRFQYFSLDDWQNT